MLNLLDSIRGQCADLDPAVIDRHFRRMPPSYAERYAAADIVRHLRLLGGIQAQAPVAVEVQSLASNAFEILVVGTNYSGSMACITAAVAAHGFDIEDVQVSTYLDPGPEAGSGPSYFVILLRVSGHLRGRSVHDFGAELQDRMQGAFSHLAQGNLLEAQTVAADTRAGLSESGQGGRPRPAPHVRPPGYEGLVFGNDFRLEHKLARGGMSEVYLATQLSLNRTVAVKLTHHEGTDDDLLTRFNTEAVVLAQFSCAHIVQILAAGTAPDRGRGTVAWMAMEYMAGGDLARWLQQHGKLPLDLATRWFHEALQGLHYAHRRAILHRDLKPHNLLLTAEGTLKVSDFGLLKQARLAAAGVTPQGGLMGTPQYMSPEQALAEPLDERSDIYSLGTTFFHLLSGRLPFQKTVATALLMQIAQEDAPPLADVAPHVPTPLAVIVQRMMARRREARYQDVGVILEDLASYERRGLLTLSESGSFVPAAAPVSGNADTQAYRAPAD